MNKYFLNAFMASGILLLLLASCKKNNLVIDQDIVPPSFAKFNTILPTDTIKTYYIRSSNAPIKLPIGVTAISDKDRTVNISYTSSTATQGVNFNAPTSIIIPAGKALDTLVFTGLSAQYADFNKKDTVLITLTGGDIPSISTLYPRKDTYRLILRKYCEFNINDFLGDYTLSTDAQGAGAPTNPYTATIASITSTGPTSATAIVYNFGDPMFGGPYNPGDLAINPGIKIDLDWADDANFKVTVPSAGQAISVGYYGPNGLIKPASTGTGTFSSCLNTITISYSFAIGAVSYGNFKTVLRR